MSTTDTPTAEPFDAFERRLAAALANEAATVRAPDDGIDRIHARVTHRRRARRATWFAAAAALVLIAGIVGIALRPADQGSTPYVGDPTMVPVDGPPLLAPTAPALRLTMSSWQSGRTYHLVLTDTARSVGERTTNPGVVDFSVTPGALGADPLTWAPVDVDGHQAEALLSDRTATPRIRWLVAPGYVAELAGSPGTAGSLDDLVTEMRRVIATVVPTDEATMLELIDRAARNGDPATTDGFRLGQARGAGTYLQQGFGPQVASTLVVAGLPTNTYQLRSDSTSVGSGTLPTGTPKTVRGETGVLDTQSDFRGGRHQVLVWIEDGWQHRLYFTDAVSTDEALALADCLVVLGDDDWRAAVFPRLVPADLADLTWLSLTSDGDSSTATTVTGSGP